MRLIPYIYKSNMCFLIVSMSIFFPEAQSFHRQQRWHGTGPRGCSASAWVAKGWELVPESHQQNLPTRKLPVWEFFQLRHKYPFSNRECLWHPQLRAGVLKKLLDSFSSSSLPESHSVFISIPCKPLVIGSSAQWTINMPPVTSSGTWEYP